MSDDLEIEEFLPLDGSEPGAEVSDATEPTSGWSKFFVVAIIILLVCAAAQICRRMCKRRAVDEEINDFMHVYASEGGGNTGHSEAHGPLLQG